MLDSSFDLAGKGKTANVVATWAMHWVICEPGQPIHPWWKALKPGADTKSGQAAFRLWRPHLLPIPTAIRL